MVRNGLWEGGVGAEIWTEWENELRSSLEWRAAGTQALVMSLFSKIEEQQGSQYSGIALEGANGRVMERQSEKTPNPPRLWNIWGVFEEIHRRPSPNPRDLISVGLQWFPFRQYSPGDSHPVWEPLMWSLVLNMGRCGRFQQESEMIWIPFKRITLAAGWHKKARTWEEPE